MSRPITIHEKVLPIKIITHSCFIDLMLILKLKEFVHVSGEMVWGLGDTYS